MTAAALLLLTGPLCLGQSAPGLPRVSPDTPPADGSPGPISASRALDEARARQEADLTQGELSGGLGIERLGEDWFARLDLALAFDFEKFGFGLQLPVRFRVIDEDPQNDDDLLGIIRLEDWDSVADVLKVVRYVYVGQKNRKGPYYFRLGALTDLTFGHGTIVHRYRNDVDVNRWRVGAEAQGRIGAFSAQAFVGDLTDPYLTGIRATVRPLELAFGKGPLLGLEVGASLVLDANAPLSNCLVRTDPGAPMDSAGACVDPRNAGALGPEATFATLLDDQGRPISAASRAAPIVGLEVGYPIFDSGPLSITPYVDLNKITAVQDGWGLHAGVLWNVSVPMVIDTLMVDVRTEYRAVSQDYRGPYVNATYEIERYESLRATPTAFGTPSKLSFLCGGTGECTGGGPLRHGYFVEVLAGLPEWIFVGGELLDYTGAQQDGTFRLTLEVPALEAVQLQASYFRVGVRDLGDLFAIDDRSAVIARARVPIQTFFNIDVEWTRIWRGDPEGGYAPVDDYRVGAGFAIPL